MKHEKVHNFLKHHTMAVISTVANDGTPWGSAIYFVADDDFTFYFVTRANTLKYQNLEAHPKAALTIVDEAEQTTVQATGSVSRVPADESLDMVLRNLAKVRPHGDLNWVPPIIKVHKGDYIVLSFKPDKLQYANYKDFKSDVHHDYIEQIIG